MSKEFYDYLAQKVVSFFNNLEIKSGDRFDIQFEKESEVLELYNAIERYSAYDTFRYSASKFSDEYKTISIKSGTLNVIIAASINGVQPDFLTRLRNEVSSESNEMFANTAILFVHNTTLDSIVNGGISFKKEGMPFHIQSIIKDIEIALSGSQLSLAQQNIIRFELDNIAAEEENASLLRFEEILKVINCGTIEKEDYKNFGLFFDNQLDSFSGKEAQDRMKENAECYSRIDAIHKFQGDINAALEVFLDEKGVDLLSNVKTWDDTDFSTVMISIDNKKKTKKIQYEGYDLFNIDEDNFWEKPQFETQAGLRKRRILIFNPEREDRLQFSLRFDERISQKQISIGEKQEAKASASGKKIIIEIEHEIGKVSFNSVKLNASESYEFKFMIIDLPNSIFKDTLIQTSFNINRINKENVILLNLDQSNILINPSGEITEEITLRENNESISVDSLDAKIVITNEVEVDENVDYVRFNMTIQGIKIPIAVKDEGQFTVPIGGYNVWLQKREGRLDFKYINGRLIQGSRSYYPKDEFKTNLIREEQIIKDGSFYFVEKNNGILGQSHEVPTDLLESYGQLINYYRVNQLLPSLAFYNKELIQLSINYIDSFIKNVNSLEEGGYITNLHRCLGKIGTYKVDNEHQVLLTPLHPLNVMYQIMMQQQVKNEKIHDSLGKKLDSVFLLPYLSEYQILYKPLEQSHSKEWKYYVVNSALQYKGSRKFVDRLVKEKIEEFVEHFSYIFELSIKAPIRINLINTGDSIEILQGLIDYYISQLKKGSKIYELKEIYLSIYCEDDTNAFEELSFLETVNEVEENLKLTLDLNGINKDYRKEDILSICREKIKFYKKDINSNLYDYCHIAFYEMSHVDNEKDSKMYDMVTGVSLNGLVSGVPSKFINDSYRTGFGNKYMDNSSENRLLRVAAGLNSLYRTIQTEVSYSKYECRTTIVSEQDQKKLDRIYNSSSWVTFIDPKIDLKFFKQNVNNQDLLIIHYSDQYTSSSGYDAITVTRKSEQYSLIIKEFLKEKNIDTNDSSVMNVINCFNAFNGDWLLRLISRNEQFGREKISIISAIKLSLAYFYHKNIIWIPISLEEVLRVSKGAGLSGAEGLFSVKNLKGDGQYSDDVLLIGIEVSGEELYVHYYPIEVKIGANSSSIIDKAKKQAYKTRNYLEKHLIELTGEDETRAFSKKMYRNFMMQQAIISVEKIKLYDIWNEQKWDIIIDSDIRRRLLNDDYKIANHLDFIIGRGAIISFKTGISFNDEAKELIVTKEELGLEYNEEEFEKGNKFLEIVFGESQAYNNILKNTNDVVSSIQIEPNDFKKENLLANIYSKSNYEENNIDGNASVDEEIGAGDKSGHENSETVPDVDAPTMPEVSEHPLKILFGNNAKTNEEVYWHPTDTSKTLHTNTGIIGTMGTGKTQFTKSLIYQISKSSANNVDGQKIGILIFDYKGDYIDPKFVGSTDATVLDIYKLPYNPLAIVRGSISKPLLPLHTANALKETISKAFNLGIKQETLLRDLIMGAYEQRNIDKADQSTWDKLPPTLNEVCELYFDRDDVAQDSLYAALKNLHEFEIFEPNPTKTKPLMEIIDGVTVLNLAGYDSGIQNLVVAITLDIFYSQMLTLGESKMQNQYRQLTNMILVDEADNFLSKNFDSIKKILKEGRMFGVGTILSTQLLSHFSTGDNEYANYILTWIVHNVLDLSNKDVKYIFNTKAKEDEDAIYNKIKSLEKHHSLVKLGGETGPLYVRDKAFWELT